MYLIGDAKLWWRSKFSAGVCSIKTWADLKKELLSAFFPENVEYNARKKLRDLTHTGVGTSYNTKRTPSFLGSRRYRTKGENPEKNHNFDFGLLESVVSTKISSRPLRSSPE
ncbi:hypothetical protein V6N11_047345 [Hibiscus sabdariffa]|uniref:Retrotransposon gag domain-containing protein n=1 Tax=Hibiscus sabdariffa TaxID=183260 RepID=A0ABR2PBP5_9ROSI